MENARGLSQVCEELERLVEGLSTGDAATVRAVKRQVKLLRRAVGQVNRGLDQLQAAVGTQKSPPGSVRD